VSPFLFNRQRVMGGVGGGVGAVEEGLGGEGGVIIAAAEGVGMGLQSYDCVAVNELTSIN
jgi:hypothetical protein